MQQKQIIAHFFSASNRDTKTIKHKYVFSFYYILGLQSRFWGLTAY